MTRSTPEDEAFKRRVAEEFARARDLARRQKFSYDEFLSKLGVTRAAFHKYMTQKAIPSLRVLHRARKYWGVQLAYGDLGEDYVTTKRRDPRQLELFSVADVSKDQIEVKRISPKGETAVELLLRIDFSKTA